MKNKKENRKLEKFKTVFKRIMSVITVLSFIFGLLIFAAVLKANKGEVPSVFGYSLMRVKTGSMEGDREDSIKTGSIILTKKVDEHELDVNDIISFYSTDPAIKGEVETHRIVERHSLVTGEREYITKGDANQSDDEYPVLYKNVIGKYVKNFGVASGSVLGILQNPKVIFFLIILPMIFITFSEAVNLVNLIVNRNVSEEQIADESEKKNRNKNKDTD